MWPCVNRHLRQDGAMIKWVLTVMKIGVEYWRLGFCFEAEVKQMHQQFDAEGLIRFADFLRKELPIRLARCIQDFDQVLHLSEMKSFISVKSCHVNSFREITAHPEIQSELDESSFASLLHKLYQNHSGALINMATGAFQLRKHQALFHSNIFRKWMMTSSVSMPFLTDLTPVVLAFVCKWGNIWHCVKSQYLIHIAE